MKLFFISLLTLISICLIGCETYDFYINAYGLSNKEFFYDVFYACSDCSYADGKGTYFNADKDFKNWILNLDYCDCSPLDPNTYYCDCSEY